MSDTKSSGVGFLVLCVAVGIAGWRLGGVADAPTTAPESPNACATSLLAGAGYGPASFVTAERIPPALQAEITTRCLAPHLTPATADTDR